MKPARWRALGPIQQRRLGRRLVRWAGERRVAPNESEPSRSDSNRPMNSKEMHVELRVFAEETRTDQRGANLYRHRTCFGGRGNDGRRTLRNRCSHDECELKSPCKTPVMPTPRWFCGKIHHRWFDVVVLTSLFATGERKTFPPSCSSARGCPGVQPRCVHPRSD